jgi:hypothetical protein
MSNKPRNGFLNGSPFNRWGLPGNWGVIFLDDSREKREFSGGIYGTPIKNIMWKK